MSDPGTVAEIAALRRNLRELVELDAWFGVSMLPKPVERGTGSARQALVPAPVTPPAPTAAGVQEPVGAQPSAEPLPSDPVAALAQIARRIAACQACTLCSGRRNTVPGEGAPRPRLLFIGEGPGADEDRSGRPFVGPAGQLLDKMITAMGLARDQVYIANVVKCRPPDNRTPESDEVAACLPYLEQQVQVLAPRIICTLGNTPLRALTGDPTAGITRHRGRPFQWRGITVVPTFHPSYLLRNPDGKKPCWEDLKKVMALLATG